MKYIIAIVILMVLIALYIMAYLLNSKVDKPDSCKDIDCNGCNLNCNKRGELNE